MQIYCNKSKWDLLTIDGLNHSLSSNDKHDSSDMTEVPTELEARPRVRFLSLLIFVFLRLAKSYPTEISLKRVSGLTTQLLDKA